jgi:hypothetical protein
MESVPAPVKKLLDWLSGSKGTPVDQVAAFDAAHELVEAWKVGWKDEAAEQPDRAKLLRDTFRTDAAPHLLQVMRIVGPLKTFTEVGADEELAANIVSIGTALKLFQTK